MNAKMKPKIELILDRINNKVLCNHINTRNETKSILQIDDDINQAATAIIFGVRFAHEKCHEFELDKFDIITKTVIGEWTINCKLNALFCEIFRIQNDQRFYSLLWAWQKDELNENYPDLVDKAKLSSLDFVQEN